ncbi:MAG: VOC family protein [Myxococcales bacterium]|nr:VOC family protein [Myxococcales bacterium]
MSNAQPAQVSLPSDSAVQVTRSFNAPRELVWRAYTSPALLQRWLLGPPGWALVVCEMDMRVGGSYRWRWRSEADGKSFGFDGELREVTRPSRMVHTQRYVAGDIGGDMGDGEAIVTVELREEAGITTVVTTIDFGSQQARDAAMSTGMTDGMEQSYQLLDGALDDGAAVGERSPIIPCIWLDSEAEEAARFYVETFQQAAISGSMRYPESSAGNPSGKAPGSVMTVSLELRGQRLLLLNGGPMYKLNANISLFAHAGDSAEVDRLYAALSDGGQALMPLDSYPWSERYAWVVDRFGVSWQLMAGAREDGAHIVPCLMFAAAQRGKAKAAIDHYCKIFERSRVEQLEHYSPEEQGPEGGVKHGRFTIAGQPMVAMDAHVAHEGTFNEAFSLQVICSSQPEVDRYWAALCDGGEEGQCGWLKDRFGVSWQVVKVGA